MGRSKERRVRRESLVLPIGKTRPIYDLVKVALGLKGCYVKQVVINHGHSHSTASTARLCTIRSVNSSGVNLAWVVGVALLRRVLALLFGTKSTVPPWLPRRN